MLSRHPTRDESLPESAVKMRGTEESPALRAAAAEHGIEEAAAFIATTKLCRGFEERHGNQRVLTGRGIVLQS